LKIELLPSQHSLLYSPARFTGLVAGMGAGKTWAGCHGLIKAGLEHGCPQAYFAPTYPMIRDIFYPTIEEVADLYGLDISINFGDKEVSLLDGDGLVSLIKCRSMENPKRIVGFKVGHAHVDEIDTMRKDKAEEAWKKIVARLRYPDAPNTAHVTCTPEGFAFMHSRFMETESALYHLVRASTFSNEKNLPPGYIDAMMETYDARQVEAYLKGQFVNLTMGNVYHDYGPENHRTVEVGEFEPLHVGMDFNIGKMAAVFHVERDNDSYAVGEISRGYDTRDVIDTIQHRFPRRKIVVYPDSTGGNRDTGAQRTDIQLLEDAGFLIDAPEANPRIMDRVNVYNGRIRNAKGERKYFVDRGHCPDLNKCLTRQPWGENGKPDKSGDLDHAPDAGGYYAHRRFSTNRADGRSLRIGFAQ